MLSLTQKENRRLGIGGTDVAGILGLSKYKTPLQVYFDKKEDQEDINNQFIEWGNRLEEVVATAYQDKTKTEITACVKTHQHKDIPYIRGNFDYHLNDGNILEIKTSSHFRAKDFGEDMTDIMPVEYYLQCMHYATIADCEFVDLAVLIGGNDFRRLRYIRNEKTEKIVQLALRKFWEEHVLADVPPSPSTPAECLGLFGIAQENSEIVADENLVKKIEKFKLLQEENKKIKKHQDEVKRDILMKLKESSKILSSEGRVLATWKNSKLSRFDVSSFKADNGSLYEEYVKSGSTRRFVVNI